MSEGRVRIGLLKELRLLKGLRLYLLVIVMILAVVFLRFSETVGAGDVRRHFDFIHFFKWWLTLFGLGIIFIPTTYIIFKAFETKGYIFSKIIGLAVSGYIVWTFASIRIGQLRFLPFRAWVCYLVLALCLGVNIYISRKFNIHKELVKDRVFLRKIVFQEFLFGFALFYWTFLKGISPAILDLEKFMDFGFMNAILRSDYFPPLDMWFASEPINYYYLGQYFSAYLTRISFVPPEISYNLMIATLFALTFMASYTIGEHLFEIFVQNSKSFNPLKYAKTACGILTGALVTLSGSWHTPIYTIFTPDRNPHGRYWFPDATRYIGHNPHVLNDQTIHEFPLYSFIVSDLHAHVINVIFVLTVIAIAFAVAISMLKKSSPYMERLKGCWPGYCMVIFLIGLFPATNYWDFPIYIVVVGVVYFYVNLRIFDYKFKAWAISVVHVIVILAASFAVGTLFHLNFVAISTQVLPVPRGTALNQLMVLYGYQALFFAMLIATSIVAYYRFNAPSANEQKAENLPLYTPVSGSKQLVFYDFIEKTNPADVLVLILFTCAIGLIAIPEFVYVDDIYPSDPRGNTMFKLCFQAFIMLAIGVGYTFSRMFLCKEKKGYYKTRALALSVVLLIGAFMYPFHAIPYGLGTPHFSNYVGLDGIRYMRTHQEQLTWLPFEHFPEGEEPEGEPHEWPMVFSLADDYWIVRYINANIEGQPVIAEADFSSYTTFGRVAAKTGLPSVFNWEKHQTLWRNYFKEYVFDGYEYIEVFAELRERIDDLRILYTTEDVNVARNIINKYNISYIMVGELERARFRDINEPLLRSLGEIVREVNSAYLIAVGDIYSS